MKRIDFIDSNYTNMKVTLLLFSLCFPAVLMAQTWQSYTTTNGLAHNEVRAIFTDQYGVKWFGTKNGLSRFDGTSWTTYTTSNTNLPSNAITDVQSDLYWLDKLWVATEGGLALFDITASGIGSTVKYTTDNSNLISNSLTSIGLDRDGSKYIGSAASGVTVIEGDTWTKVDKNYSFGTGKGLSSNVVREIATAGDTAYFALDNGVSRIISKVDGLTSASRWNGTYLMYAFLSTSDDIRSVHTDRFGNFWAGTSNGVANIYTGETWEVWNVDSGMVSNTILSICRDKSGGTWFGTDAGISRLSVDGESFTNYTAGASSVVNNTINDIVHGTDGKIWVATNGGVSSYYEPYLNVEAPYVPRPRPFTILLAPNPVSNATQITVSLPSNETVSARIYDPSGRLVYTFADHYPSGKTSVWQWNACDLNGARVPAGTYFFVVNNRNLAQSKKIMVVEQ